MAELTVDMTYGTALFDAASELGRVDQIRREFGERSIVRGIFVNTPMAPIDGGVNDGDYIMMGGYRNEDLG